MNCVKNQLPIALTALEKISILYWSFSPSVSTPVDTSTIHGFATSIASATFEGVRPPASINLLPSGIFAATSQLKLLPVPPRCPFSFLSRIGIAPLYKTTSTSERVLLIVTSRSCPIGTLTCRITPPFTLSQYSGDSSPQSCT